MDEDHILLGREVDYSSILKDTKHIALYNFSMKLTREDFQNVASDRDSQQSDTCGQIHNASKVMIEIQDGTNSFAEYPELDEALLGLWNPAELVRNTSTSGHGTEK